MIKNNGEPSPMRIGIVMGKYATGGIKSVLLNYYHFVDKRKIQFDFIIDDDSPITDFQDILDLGGRVYKIPSIKSPIRNVIAEIKLFKKNGYSCVHGYINTLNVFPMFAAKVAGVPVRIAENLSTGHPGEHKDFIKQVLKPMATWFPTKLAANSKYAANWLYGSQRTKDCLILRNALDLEKIRYDVDQRSAARKALGVSSDTILIGHVGRYEYQKNHKFLVKILSELARLNENVKFVLVGYGSLKKEIFDKVDELGLSKYVIDAGATENIIPLYNAMDCFVLPSFYEGLPVVGIEAQATGLPCVFSDEITDEVRISKNVQFLSLSDSPATWANCILELARKKRDNDTQRMISGGYDIVHESQRLTNFYLDAVDGK